MIGDVPRGAPLRCRLGRHKGQSDGGTLCFTCPDCGGSYMQERDYSAVTAAADALVAQGRFNDAERLARMTPEQRKRYDESTERYERRFGKE